MDTARVITQRELRPIRRRTFVPAEVAVAAFAIAPRHALDDLRRDLDEWVEQDAEPRT